MAGTSSSGPQPHRRCLTFSLRMLLIFMLGVGTLLGVFMRQWNRAEVQRKAIEALAARGYAVRYDWQGATLTWKRDPLIVDGAQSSVPDVLREWLGNDFFHDVVSVNWGHWSDSGYQREAGAADLWQTLQGLPGVTHLEVVKETIPAHAQLGSIARTKLRVLYFSDCQFESAQVEGLTDRLTALEQLYLLDTKAEGAVLERFLANQRLTTLELYSPLPSAVLGLHAGGNLTSLKIRGRYQPISAEQIRAVGCCTGLQELELEGGVGLGEPADALDPLAALRQLTSLRLYLGQMTDRHLLALQDLTNLRHLDVRSRLIDGKSLADIRSAGQLRSLTFRYAQVSDTFLARIDEFKELESLTLIGPHTNSTGLIAARWPPSLRSLALPARMDLDVVRSLRELTQLRTLRLGVWDDDVPSEQLTAEIDALKAALSQCKVDAYVAMPFLTAE